MLYSIRSRGEPGGRAQQERKTRRGAVVLELILALPILVLLILAIVQFGVFHARMQQVALACRVGAEEASQTTGLSTTNGDPVPPNVRDAIDHQLNSSGIDRCRVRLEHNVGGNVVVLGSPTTGACDCGPTSLPSAPFPPTTYVRLTVCVPMGELMPNCLRVVGYNVANPSRVAECTTVFRYEL
jgi:Flp pilus assembly protein TadG